MLRFAIFLCLSVAIAGCASTDPGSGAAIQYRLPETKASAVLTLAMVKCPDKNGAGMELEPSLAIVAKASAGDDLHVIYARDLASVRTKRTLTVNVDDNGVISGINSEVEDRTAAIIANVASTAVKVAAIALAPDIDGGNGAQSKLTCKDDFEDIVERASDLKEIVETLQIELAKADAAASRKELREEIDAVAFEIARLRTGPLSKAVVANIPLTLADGAAQDLVFKYDGLLEDWFNAPALITTDGAIPNPNPPTEQERMDAFFGVRLTINDVTAHPVQAKAAKDNCKFKIAVPAQTKVTIKLKPSGEALADVGEKAATIPVAQRGGDEFVCLSARFAESRSMNMAFNAFGERKSLTWSSGARGEAISGAVASLAESGGTVTSLFDEPSELERQKALIGEVDTRLKYNAAKLCEEAAKAGATSCPTTDTGN